MADDQKKLQELSDAYQKLQTDLQASITARQRLESQQQENKGVQKEFSLLPSNPSPPDPSKPPSRIYKLVGPVLLPQSPTEATTAVHARLQYIEREIKRLEAQISERQVESERVRGEVVALQSMAQAGGMGTAMQGQQ